MRKSFLALSLTSMLVFGTTSIASAAEKDHSYLDDIILMEPDLTSDELLSSVKEISKDEGISKEKVLEQIYQEIKADQDKARKEHKSQTFGGSGGTVPVGNSTKGNFYYTPSQTAYLDHGHVGLYYTSTTIVESVPNDGVRTISTANRKVDPSGAMVKSVTTSTENRNAAANWAYSELGERYSYNFVTNRSTSHYGAKNCSKLIWSAYLLKAGLDLDVDKGLGVYPRDVRDAPNTKLVRNI